MKYFISLLMFSLIFSVHSGDYYKLTSSQQTYSSYDWNTGSGNVNHKVTLANGGVPESSFQTTTYPNGIYITNVYSVGSTTNHNRTMADGTVLKSYTTSFVYKKPSGSKPYVIMHMTLKIYSEDNFANFNFNDLPTPIQTQYNNVFDDLARSTDIDEFFETEYYTDLDALIVPTGLNNTITNSGSTLKEGVDANGNDFQYFDSNDNGLWDDGELVIDEAVLGFTYDQLKATSNSIAEDTELVIDNDHSVTYLKSSDDIKYNVTNGNVVVFWKDENSNNLVDDGEISLDAVDGSIGGSLSSYTPSAGGYGSGFSGSGDFVASNGTIHGENGDNPLSFSYDPNPNPDPDPDPDPDPPNDPDPNTDSTGGDTNDPVDNSTDPDPDPTNDTAIKSKLDDINNELDNISENQGAVNDSINNNGVKLDDINSELDNITENTGKTVDELREIKDKLSDPTEMTQSEIDSLTNIDGQVDAEFDRLFEDYKNKTPIDVVNLPTINTISPDLALLDFAEPVNTIMPDSNKFPLGVYTFNFSHHVDLMAIVRTVFLVIMTFLFAMKTMSMLMNFNNADGES